MAVNTNSRRVWFVTGIERPVTVPEDICPTEITPVNAGANVTSAPATAVKLLFGVDELYNCAVIVIVLPTRLNAAVVLKNADILVIVPALGIEKAKFVRVPAAFVRSMIPPAMLTPGAEDPKPINPGVPTSPPAIVVRDTGIPELYGMMAELPAVPVAPVEPRLYANIFKNPFILVRKEKFYLYLSPLVYINIFDQIHQYAPC